MADSRIIETKQSSRRYGYLSGKLAPVAARVRELGALTRMVRWFALLPCLAILVGPFFLNRVTPFVFGMPLLLAWLVAWIVLTPAIMAVVFWFDPTNREERE
jgi:uncharacterized protein DUF3311